LVVAAVVMLAVSVLAAAEEPKAVAEPKVEAVAEERDPYRDMRRWRPNEGTVVSHEHVPRTLTQEEIHRRFHKPAHHWAWANEKTPEPKLRHARGEESERVMSNLVLKHKREKEKEPVTVPADIVHREKDRFPEEKQHLVQAISEGAHKPEPRVRRDIISADIVHSEREEKPKHRKRLTFVADAHIDADPPKRRRHRRSHLVVANAHAERNGPSPLKRRRHHRRHRSASLVTPFTYVNNDAEPSQLEHEREERARERRRQRRANRVTVTPFTYINNDSDSERHHHHRRHRRSREPQLVSAEQRFGRGEEDSEADEPERRHRKHRRELVSADLKFNRLF